MIRIGDEIPDLEAEVYLDGEIKNIRLSDYRGKWLVMAFYPRDFTFVCPTELEDLAMNHDKFRKEGAEIVSSALIRSLFTLPGIWTLLRLERSTIL
jgi:peroxiredoxin (alkyl hydroperoxide reductase subunit C)